MQIRPYPERDSNKLWLSQRDQARLLATCGDEYPRRRIAFEMGLHGLRSDEIRRVTFGDFRSLDEDEESWVMVVPDGKTGRRSVPIDPDLKQRIVFLKSASRAPLTEPVVDVATRTMRSWMSDHRDQVAEETENDDWLDLGMHDLRRTWATEFFYSLAINGNPIAEELTMAYGGWRMTATGRETFRSAYLGPVPDHVTQQAVEML